VISNCLAAIFQPVLKVVEDLQALNMSFPPLAAGVLDRPRFGSLLACSSVKFKCDLNRFKSYLNIGLQKGSTLSLSGHNMLEFITKSLPLFGLIFANNQLYGLDSCERHGYE